MPVLEYARHALARWRKAVVAPSGRRDAVLRLRRHGRRHGAPSARTLRTTARRTWALRGIRALRLAKQPAAGIQRADGNQAVILDATTGEVQETGRSRGPARHLLVRGAARSAMVDGALACWDGADWQAIRACALPAAVSFGGVIGDWYVAAGVDGIRLVALDGKRPDPADRSRPALAGAGPGPQLPAGVPRHGRFPPHRNRALLRPRRGRGHRAGDTTDLFYLQLDGELLRPAPGRLLPPSSRPDSLLAEAEAWPRSSGRAGVGRTAAGLCRSARGVGLANRGGADAPPATFAELAASRRMPWTREEYARYLLIQLLMEEGGLPADALAPALEALRAANLPLDAPARGAAVWNGVRPRPARPRPRRPGTGDAPRAAPVGERRCAAARSRGASGLRAQSQQPKPGGGSRLSGARRRHRSHTDAALLSPESAIPHCAGLEHLAGTTDTNVDHPVNYEVSQGHRPLPHAGAPWLDLQLHPLCAKAEAHDGAFQALLDAVMAYLAGEIPLERCLSALGAA